MPHGAPVLRSQSSESRPARVRRASMAPNGLWLDVEPLVRRALRDADRGRAVSVPSLRYRVISRVAGMLPLSSITRVAKRKRWAA